MPATCFRVHRAWSRSGGIRSRAASMRPRSSSGRTTGLPPSPSISLPTARECSSSLERPPPHRPSPPHARGVSAHAPSRPEPVAAGASRSARDQPPVTMQTLHSWTEDGPTRHFSGVATYEKLVQVPEAMLAAGLRIELDFLARSRPSPRTAPLSGADASSGRGPGAGSRGASTINGHGASRAASGVHPIGSMSPACFRRARTGSRSRSRTWHSTRWQANHSPTTVRFGHALVTGSSLRI